MQIENYLKNYQPIVYKTFTNALINKKLSHAYLINGNPGTPLLEVAKFLAKSILCDDPSPLACNNCITCVRIDDNNYQDYILVDGSLKTINKNDVVTIEERFEKKAFEDKNIMIYVLHLVENMTAEAVNSILKFLEEPECEVYAFLTTNNTNNILPTIVSRCQLLNLKQIDQHTIIEKAIELGVEKENAEILSNFYNDSELIFDFLNDKNKSELFFDIKEKLLSIFASINNQNKKEAIFIYQTDIIPLISTKEDCRFLFDILIAFYEDLLRKQNGNSIMLTSYDKILSDLLINLTNISETLIELLKQRGLINLNVNTSLLLDHIFLQIINGN